MRNLHVCNIADQHAGKHTIFGRISSGMRVIQMLGSVPTGAADKPVETIRINKAIAE